MGLKIVSQCLLTFLIVLANASLQTLSYLKLNDKSVPKNNDIDMAKQYLISSMFAQYLSSFLMLVAVALLYYKREEYAVHMSKLIYLMLVFSTLVMFSGGVLGAMAATKLQCYKKDSVNINTAWNMTTITAVSGILGMILILTIQAFMHKKTLEQRAERAAQGILLRRGEREAIEEARKQYREKIREQAVAVPQVAAEAKATMNSGCYVKKPSYYPNM
jgi:hypothetical protein